MGKIDIVIPWVDDSDVNWIEMRNNFKKLENPNVEATSEIRFQNWDNLKYLFRAIEKFMPWVNRVFLVTCGHFPEWINEKYPKIRLVKHSDYIPDKYLPTFNSNTIEMNYHRIYDLSENFILFNDDMLPLQSIKSEYYFKNNMICDEAVENIIVTARMGPVSNMARYTQINNMMIINKYFNKRDVQAKYPKLWFETDYGERNERTKSLCYWNDFPGFYDPHLPSAMKKSVLENLWNLEPEILDRSSRNHFRAYNDVTQYLIRYWQICMGDIYGRKTEGKVYFVDKSNYKDIANIIRTQGQQTICINENCTNADFQIIKNEINMALEYLLPEKCSFEK